jgi:hypothetical protein
MRPALGPSGFRRAAEASVYVGVAGSPEVIDAKRNDISGSNRKSINSNTDGDERLFHRL